MSVCVNRVLRISTRLNELKAFIQQKKGKKDGERESESMVLSNDLLKSAINFRSKGDLFVVGFQRESPT